MVQFKIVYFSSLPDILNVILKCGSTVIKPSIVIWFKGSQITSQKQIRKYL